MIFKTICSYLYDKYLDWLRPKNSRKHKFYPIQRPQGDNRTQKYTRNKIPDNFDSLIIGSGISGLACGAALAKNGKKVLVLEKHDIAGGSIHSFKDLGVEFDTGLHYVGNIEKRMPLINFLGDFSIEWHKIGEGPTDKKIFDRFFIFGKKYQSISGEDNLLNELITQFPKEESNIRRYLSETKVYAQKDLFFKMKVIQNEWVRWLIRKIWGSKFFKLSSMSSYDYVKQFTSNPELNEVLCALSIDGGLPPKEQSSFIHASIVNHFLNGGYYPVGGAKVITQSLIRTIEKSGGRVLVRAGVERILHHQKEVTGVVLENGEELYCSNVISSVGLPNTFEKLVSGISDYQNYLSRVPSSLTYFFLYVVCEGTSEELELESSNRWIWGQKDEKIEYPVNKTLFDEHWEKFELNPEEVRPIVFIASNSAKDPDWVNKYPEKSALCVISQCSYKMFKDVDRGDEEYLRRKQIFEEKLFEILYEHFPKTQGKVLKSSTGSPLTVEYYLNSKNGACYGMDSNLERFGDYEIRPQTPIKGLYLTGQDITTLGFTGSLMSGILTANAIEGYGKISDFLWGRELISDLMKYEKRS